MSEPTRRSKRRILTKIQHDKKYKILKAFEVDLNKVNSIRKPSELPVPSKQVKKPTSEGGSRQKRENDEDPKDFKSLQQILDEFKNTRDAIQDDFEWKYYNASIWETTPTKPTSSPTSLSIPIRKEDPFDSSPTQCQCHLGIILAVLSFGALIATAYAIQKLVNYMKREK